MMIVMILSIWNRDRTEIGSERTRHERTVYIGDRIG